MFRGCAIVQGCGGKNDLGRLYTEPLRQPPWPSALFAWTLSRATRDQRMSRCRIAFVSTHLFPLYEDRLARLLALFAVPRVGLTNCQPRSSEVVKCIYQKDREWRVSYDPDAVSGQFQNEKPSRTCSRHPLETMALRRMDPEESIHFVEFVQLFVENMLFRMRHLVHHGHFWHTVRTILVFHLNRVWTTYHGFATGGIMTRRPKGLSRQAVKAPTASVTGSAYILHYFTQTMSGLRRVRHTEVTMSETSFDDAR